MNEVSRSIEMNEVSPRPCNEGTHIWNGVMKDGDLCQCGQQRGYLVKCRGECGSITLFSITNDSEAKDKEIADLRQVAVILKGFSDNDRKRIAELEELLSSVGVMIMCCGTENQIAQYRRITLAKESNPPVDRVHEECYECRFQDVVPPLCAGHMQGPVGCKDFKAKEEAK